MEMKFLTAGEMIDQMKVGLYAIKISGPEGIAFKQIEKFSDIERTYKFVNSPLYVDEKDFTLKSLESRAPIVLNYDPVSLEKYGVDKFIILNEKEFKSLNYQMGFY